MKDICPQCGEEVPIMAVRQAFRVDGVLTMFHVGCLEPWYDKDIPILRVRHGIQSFVTLEPYRPEPGEEVTLEWEKMKQGKFHSLKEFTGF